MGNGESITDCYPLREQKWRHYSYKIMASASISAILCNIFIWRNFLLFSDTNKKVATSTWLKNQSTSSSAFCEIFTIVHSITYAICMHLAKPNIITVNFISMDIDTYTKYSQLHYGTWYDDVLQFCIEI